MGDERYTDQCRRCAHAGESNWSADTPQEYLCKDNEREISNNNACGNAPFGRRTAKHLTHRGMPLNRCLQGINFR